MTQKEIDTLTMYIVDALYECATSTEYGPHGVTWSTITLDDAIEAVEDGTRRCHQSEDDWNVTVPR